VRFKPKCSSHIIHIDTHPVASYLTQTMVCHPSSQRRDPPFSMSLRRQTACVVRSSQWAARLLLPSSVGRLLLLAESQRSAAQTLIVVLNIVNPADSNGLWELIGPSNNIGRGRNPFGGYSGGPSERTSVPLTIVLDRRHGFCLSTLVLRSRATCGSRLLRIVPMPGGRHPASHQRGDETLSYLSGKGLDRSSRAPLAVSR
jgi:hypothetical protein